MSLISSIRGNGAASRIDRTALPPPLYAPKPKPGPHQLGTITLQNVDQLTGMSADEIERVAEQVMEAAQQTADALHEAARKVRETGLMANERLANFVRVAGTCADAARMMQQSVAHRDDEPSPDERTNIESASLDALVAQINDVAKGNVGK